jgi:hypothetical protein
VGPRAGLDTAEKTKLLFFQLRIETRFLGCPARNLVARPTVTKLWRKMFASQAYVVHRRGTYLRIRLFILMRKFEKNLWWPKVTFLGGNTTLRKLLGLAVCNRPNGCLFGGPEFNSRTPLHYCTFSGMPVYFWEHVGTCWPDVGALSLEGAVQRVNTCRTHAQTSPSDQSRYIVMSAGGFSPYRGSARPVTAEVNIPTLLEQHFQVTLTYIRGKAVCAPKDKGKTPGL